MATFIKGDAMLDITPLDNIFILEYMPRAEDDFVKAYLFGLMQCTHSFAQDMDIAAILGMDEARIASAFQYWQSAGLVRIISDAPLSVEYLRPWQTSAHVSNETPRKYASLITALSEVAGTRMFTGHELSEIYDWINTFRFDEATAVFCVQQALKKHGANAKLWQMNNLARLWADNSVFTVKDAETLCEKLDERNVGAQAILKRWKRMRAATEDEIKLYIKWREEWGMEQETILSACQEMTGATQPSFKYLDTILDSYRLSGTLSAQQAAALRKKRDAMHEFTRVLFERANLKKAPTLTQREQVEAWQERWHMPAELILLAADFSREEAQPFFAIKRTVTAFHDEGITTVEAAQAFLKQAHGKASKGKSAKSKSYIQRKYSDDDLKGMGIRLLED